MSMIRNIQQIKQNDIVRSFKWERLTEEQRSQHIHIYRVLEFGYNTETGEKLVIYKALSSGDVWVTPYEMFMEEVDHETHPDIKQKYRFEKITNLKELTDLGINVTIKLADTSTCKDN